MLLQSKHHHHHHHHHHQTGPVSVQLSAGSGLLPSSAGRYRRISSSSCSTITLSTSTRISSAAAVNLSVTRVFNNRRLDILELRQPGDRLTVRSVRFRCSDHHRHRVTAEVPLTPLHNKSMIQKLVVTCRDQQVETEACLSAGDSCDWLVTDEVRQTSTQQNLEHEPIIHLKRCK